MSINKKGYFFIILFLGIAGAGLGTIIYGHSVYTSGDYSGLGMSGIHATMDGSLHIPNGIWLGHIGDTENYTNIIPTNTGSLYMTLPDHNGTVLVMDNLPFQCGQGQALKGVDVNGYLYCGSIGGQP